MLKIVLLILCFIWRPSWAEGQSIEQYKKTLRAGQQELDTRQALLHEHEIHTLIPEVLEAALQAENQKEAKDQQTQQDQKYQQDQAEQQERQDQQKLRTEAAESASQTPRDEEPLNPSAAPQAAHAAPEATTATTATTASASQTEKPNATLDAWLQRRTLDIDDTLSVAPRLTPPQVDTVRWGITLGSSIPVKLIGGASSVQQGWVRFEVLKTISGQLDALPAGTLLFGAPSAHQGSDRLHIHVIKGITPEGEEFELNGWIRAQDGLDGLLGQVVSDGQVLNRSLSAVAQAAGQAALENISPPGVTISALKSGARTAQDEQSQASEATYGRPEYIVQAQAQAATLDIYETF